MNINSHGYWEGLEANEQHCYDERLSDQLVKFFKNENAEIIADFGCGMGTYVQKFNDENIVADGYDGNPNTEELTKSHCHILDLSEPIEFDKPYDWIMSLEVGEHIPKEYEDIFINNLHTNNKYGIVLSWAIPGQGGCGHVNEQDNMYVKTKICQLGYTNDVEAENVLRQNSSLFWFRNTIMVFRKNNST